MITALGELLIDFVALERGQSVGYAETFQKAAGGAPANVAVGCARLGVPTAFITQLGNDPFGHFLAETLESNGVNISGVRFTDEANTMLAFVAVEADGERSFAFYRNPSADMLMTSFDLDPAQIADARIFHFGSITLSTEPMRTTTLDAVEMARRAGAIISYDPNLREVLWPDLDTAREGMLAGLNEAHLVKMNEGELAFLTENSGLASVYDMVSAARQLWHERLRLMVITRGGEGCLAVTADRHWTAEGFAVEVEDLIGAGDGFMAGLLSAVHQYGGWDFLDDDQQVLQILYRANAVGALTASRRGGIPALPTADEVRNFLGADY